MQWPAGTCILHAWLVSQVHAPAPMQQRKRRERFLEKKRVVSAAGLINTNRSLSRFRLPTQFPPLPNLPHLSRKPRSPSSSLVQKTPAPFLPILQKSPALLLPHCYRKPQLPFFLTRSTSRLVIRYSAQIRERDATPSRKMESADPQRQEDEAPASGDAGCRSRTR